jgi:two-component system response regulator
VIAKEGIYMVAKTILLVEDNADDEELTVRALKKNNVTNEYVVARDGVEALDFLLGTGAYVGRDVAVLPGLVLLDLKLPKIAGLAVLRRIRGEPLTRRLPVVVLTGSREEQDLITSYDLGANSYIRKPVDFEQLTEAVGQLGLYWLTLNEALPLDLPANSHRPGRFRVLIAKDFEDAPLPSSNSAIIG